MLMNLKALKDQIYGQLWQDYQVDSLHAYGDYDSDVCRMLHDKELGLHLMSDTYIVNDLRQQPARSWAVKVMRIIRIGRLLY